MLGGRTVAFAADSRGIVRMSPTPADWMKIAEYGFGALALVWIGIYVVVPLRDRHTKFLDKVEETNDRLTNAIDKQADILLNLQTGMNQLSTNHKEIIDKLTTIQQHLRMP